MRCGCGGEDTLQTTKTCKGKEEFKVTKACLEAGLMYWYVGVVVTFTTLTGAIETALTERLDKTTLDTLRRKLTAHSQKGVIAALQTV